jgi:hypothetical protein
MYALLMGQAATSELLNEEHGDLVRKHDGHDKNVHKNAVVCFLASRTSDG